MKFTATLTMNAPAPEAPTESSLTLTMPWTRKSPLLDRIRRVIETTDWERRFLCNRTIDRACLGGILISAFYFTASLLLSVMK
jgi:hypothetical protein